jgi:hypothetical protein
MEHSDIDNLKKYVIDQITTPDVKNSILRLLENSPKVSKTVYRGHGSSKTIRESIFYSSTESETVAREEFSGKGCCVFKIHLVNVPAIDVNKMVSDSIGNYGEEKEYIFLGGGKFYKTRNLEKGMEGFTEVKPGTFETWYSIQEIPPATPPTYAPKFSPIDTRSVIDRVLAIIPEEEYELFDTPDEVKEIVSDYGIILGEKDAKSIFGIMKKGKE